MDSQSINSQLACAGSFTNVLGVMYQHCKTSDGGDIYLTEFGRPIADFLDLENWYEKEWFDTRKERLQGTGSVYKIATKTLDAQYLNLVVKNCRMGENVPLDTHTLMEFVNAEFNSAWEEFSLVMEMRDNAFGPSAISLQTQQPLAIYVPPEKLQLWQTGRSRSKMNRIAARHPGIYLDILRQYKLVYRWIEGKNLVELLEGAGITGEQLDNCLAPMTKKVIADLDAKGYAVADMKPVHIIIGEAEINTLRAAAITATTPDRFAVCGMVRDFIESGRYSVVDYELLLRTPGHEQRVKSTRRHSYLDHQRDRFKETPLPQHLKAQSVFNVPYIVGHVESTGGYLWVVGRDPNLFDFFLPERWRKTPSKKLSAENEVYYMVTKDNVHIVWKTSKVGEIPSLHSSDQSLELARRVGYNSPFEEFALAQFLQEHNLPTVYVRAIYVTGSSKMEQSADVSRYTSHAGLIDPYGNPLLGDDHNYITIRGYYNGPDRWVAEQESRLLRPIDLVQAFSEGILEKAEYEQAYGSVIRKLSALGIDGTLLSGNDLIITTDERGAMGRDAEGLPEARICNFELLSGYRFAP